MSLETAELTLLIGEDNTIRWVSMVDADGDPVTTATVVASVYAYDRTQANHLGAVIDGAGGLAIPHVVGGTYEGTLPNTVPLNPGPYWLELVANAGQGRRLIKCTARYHGKD